MHINKYTILCYQCRDVRTREVGIQEIHHKLRPFEVSRSQVVSLTRPFPERGQRGQQRDYHSNSMAVVCNFCFRLNWFAVIMLQMVDGKLFSHMKIQSKISFIHLLQIFTVEFPACLAILDLSHSLFKDQSFFAFIPFSLAFDSINPTKKIDSRDILGELLPVLNASEITNSLIL